MAAHEGVDEKQVVMYLNDTTVLPYDSPITLKLHVADIIGNSRADATYAWLCTSNIVVSAVFAMFMFFIQIAI